MLKRYFILLIISITSISSFSSYVYADINELDNNLIPVMFIHGYNDSGSSWEESEFYKELEDNDVKIKSVDYHKYNRNDITSTAVQKRVKDAFAYLGVTKTNPNQKVDIIVHSMGGLTIRWFLKENPQYRDNVRRIIFIGTPNHGSKISFLARLSDMVDNPDDYGLENDKIEQYEEYHNHYMKSLFGNYVFGKVQSYDEWLYEKHPQTIEDIKKSQDIEAGTPEDSKSLYDGTVGVTVEDGGEKYRYSKSFEEYATIQVGKMKSFNKILDKSTPLGLKDN